MFDWRYWSAIEVREGDLLYPTFGLMICFIFMWNPQGPWNSQSLGSFMCMLFLLPNPAVIPGPFARSLGGFSVKNTLWSCLKQWTPISIHLWLRGVLKLFLANWASTCEPVGSRPINHGLTVVLWGLLECAMCVCVCTHVDSFFSERALSFWSSIVLGEHGELRCLLHLYPSC